MSNLFLSTIKTIAPGKSDLYPAWQGMQYMRNMVDERATINSLDNDRYSGIKWTTVKDLLSDKSLYHF